MSGKYCCECGDWCAAQDYSSNQWFKERSKCPACVRLYQFPVQCPMCNIRTTCQRTLEEHMQESHPKCRVCHRQFRNENNLQQHMKVHRPREVACPICGVARFASSANAVAHVETGTCPGCLGKANARKRIHEFISHNAPQLQVPRITNGDYYDDDVPEYPYHCFQCQRSFKHLSALMNHQDDYHNNQMKMQRLTY